MNCQHDGYTLQLSKTSVSICIICKRLICNCTYLYLNLGTKRIKTIVSLNMGHHGVDVIGTCGGISIETSNPGVFITNLLSENDGKKFEKRLKQVHDCVYKDLNLHQILVGNCAAVS